MRQTRSKTAVCWLVSGALIMVAAGGCATQKESHTARTGIEQLLISSAIDQALDKVDLAPLRGRNVFLEPKYLDCVDKNYVLMSLQHRLAAQGARLQDKQETAEVVVAVGSGGVGTDAQELFIGIPEIPLPPPSPIAIPRLSFLTRSKLNGTAKLVVVAWDQKTKRPLMASGTLLARSDQKNWNVLGLGPVQTGSVADEVAAATKDPDLTIGTLATMARQQFTAPAVNETRSGVVPVKHFEQPKE